MLLEAPNQPGHLQWGVCDVEQVRWVQRCRASADCSKWVQWTGPGARPAHLVQCRVRWAGVTRGHWDTQRRRLSSEKAIPSTRHDEATSTALAAARNQSGPEWMLSLSLFSNLRHTHSCTPLARKPAPKLALGLPGAHDGPGACPSFLEDKGSDPSLSFSQKKPHPPKQ